MNAKGTLDRCILCDVVLWNFTQSVLFFQQCVTLHTVYTFLLSSVLVLVFSCFQALLVFSCFQTLFVSSCFQTHFFFSYFYKLQFSPVSRHFLFSRHFSSPCQESVIENRYRQLAKQVRLKKNRQMRQLNGQFGCFGKFWQFLANFGRFDQLRSRIFHKYLI